VDVLEEGELGRVDCSSFATGQSLTLTSLRTAFEFEDSSFIVSESTRHSYSALDPFAGYPVQIFITEPSTKLPFSQNCSNFVLPLLRPLSLHSQFVYSPRTMPYVDLPSRDLSVSPPSLPPPLGDSPPQIETFALLTRAWC